MLRNNQGMTLIEIMIVIAIIGGLMTVLGGKVFGSFEKAKIKQARIQLREVGKALELYATDCGSFPKSLDALVDNAENCGDWGPSSYIKRYPKDPWNHDLIYDLDGGDYVLVSLGADGQDGGEGKNKDISSDDL